jgi:hypothetical protein
VSSVIAIQPDPAGKIADFIAWIAGELKSA